MSRTVTAHLFHSLNGVVESPNLWQFGAFGPEEGELMGRSLAPATEVVMGTTLWKEWSEYWPNADDPFGSFISTRCPSTSSHQRCPATCPGTARS